jgi:transcription initiation factor TFIIA large subunit
VIQASNNDFEEFGVDQSTLDEMKQVRRALPEGAPGAAAPFL